MKLLETSRLKPIEIQAGQLRKTLATLDDDFSSPVLLGTVEVSSGFLVLFHSVRFNRDYSILIKHHDSVSLLEEIDQWRRSLNQ
ncbi:MAG: hypothetical protein IT289_10365 [Oligoflexia bacterium]|nr:hypothetical protein [Oligoflexia bacterium]